MNRREFRKIIESLAQCHGEPEPPRITNPFEMVLLENAAYLVSDEVRASTFEALRKRVGLTPAEIAGCSTSELASVIADGGMQPARRAEKLLRCAELALELDLDRLNQLTKEDPERAHRAWKKFPGIGDPGADRILLFSRQKQTLAPDSNILRVLIRLGIGEEDRSYARSYRLTSAAVAPLLPRDLDFLIRAHLLLRTHGRELCRRTQPRCEICPVADRCRHVTS